VENGCQGKQKRYRTANEGPAFFAHVTIPMKFFAIPHPPSEVIHDENSAG
jgi:hypothetical protein